MNDMCYIFLSCDSATIARCNVYFFLRQRRVMPLNLRMCIEERQRMLATVSHPDSEPSTKVRELYCINVSRTIMKKSVRYKL